MRLSRANYGRPFRMTVQVRPIIVTFLTTILRGPQGISQQWPWALFHMQYPQSSCHTLVGGRSEARLGRGVQVPRGGVNVGLNAPIVVYRTSGAMTSGSQELIQTHPLPRGPHAPPAPAPRLTHTHTHTQLLPLHRNEVRSSSERRRGAPHRTLHPIYAWFRRGT